jgi:hypothetical protein
MSQQINLFDPIFLKQPKYFSAVTMVQALAAIMAGTLLIYGYTVYQTATLEKLAGDVENEAKLRRDQLLKFGSEYSAGGGSKLVEDEIARSESRLKSRRDLLGNLKGGDAARMDAEGFSRYMAAFARQNVSGVWLTAFNVGGKGDTVVVKGRALNPDLVPAYIKSLNLDETMRGRVVSELRLVAREEPLVAPVPAPQTAPGAQAQAPAAAGAGNAPAPRMQHVIEFNLTMSSGANPPAAKSRLADGAS